MSLWAVFIAAGLLTLATRLSFIYMYGKFRMPDWFRRALRFVPPAVLSAITLPALVSPQGTLNLTLRNPELLAGAVAVLVAWRTRNVVLTIAAGLVGLLAVQFLMTMI